MTYVPDLSEKEGMEMPSQSYSFINLSCTGAFVFSVSVGYAIKGWQEFSWRGAFSLSAALTRAFNLSPEGSKDKVQKTVVCVDKLKVKLF